MTEPEDRPPTDAAPSPEGVATLDRLVVLEKMRTVLTNPSQGWCQGVLWNDHDAPYPGQGPACLDGALLVARGRGDLHMGRLHELDAFADGDPVTAEIEHTISTLYPDFGTTHWPISWASLPPSDRVALWNDAAERTLTEVLNVLDATIARVGAS